MSAECGPHLFERQARSGSTSGSCTSSNSATSTSSRSSCSFEFCRARSGRNNNDNNNNKKSNYKANNETDETRPGSGHSLLRFRVASQASGTAPGSAASSSLATTASEWLLSPYRSNQNNNLTRPRGSIASSVSSSGSCYLSAATLQRQTKQTINFKQTFGLDNDNDINDRGATTSNKVLLKQQQTGGKPLGAHRRRSASHSLLGGLIDHYLSPKKRPASKSPSFIPTFCRVGEGASINSKEHKQAKRQATATSINRLFHLDQRSPSERSSVFQAALTSTNKKLKQRKDRPRPAATGLGSSYARFAPTTRTAAASFSKLLQRDRRPTASTGSSVSSSSSSSAASPSSASSSSSSSASSRLLDSSVVSLLRRELTKLMSNF